MSRHGSRQLWMAGMPHHNMPSAVDDVKAIGSIQTSTVVLSPAKGPLTHAGSPCMFSCHKGKRSTEQQTDAIHSRSLVLEMEQRTPSLSPIFQDPSLTPIFDGENSSLNFTLPTFLCG
jgi:hypothetical protein